MIRMAEKEAPGAPIQKPAFPPSTVISVLQAATYAGVSDDTVRRWCAEHGLGQQPGGRGRWRVSAPALSAFMADDKLALAAIRAGRFDDPIVKPYLSVRFQLGARG